jgi:hypothetical protein
MHDLGGVSRKFKDWVEETYAKALVLRRSMGVVRGVRSVGIGGIAATLPLYSGS